MGVINLTRGRRDHTVVEDLRPTQETETKNEVNVEQNKADSDLSNLARAEKELQEHPDEITVGAAAGVRKAEAVALVWGKKAVYATYAW